VVDSTSAGQRDWLDRVVSSLLAEKLQRVADHFLDAGRYAITTRNPMASGRWTPRLVGVPSAKYAADYLCSGPTCRTTARTGELLSPPHMSIRGAASQGGSA
jgi:hypothetical protein